MQPTKNDAAKSKASKLGTNALQPNEKEGFGIVGSIVEKGISNEGKPQYYQSTPIPPPKPSVLPFPVARHRSHGPHWDPIGNKRGGNNDHDDNDVEDQEMEKYARIASFAGPVQRKEKKDLDFSRYKDIMYAEDSSAGRTDKKGQSAKGRKQANEKNMPSSIRVDDDVNMCAPSQMNVKPCGGDSCEVVADAKDDMKGDNLSAGTHGSVTDMEIDNIAKTKLLQKGGNSHSSNLKDEPGEIFSRDEDNTETMSIDKITSPNFVKTKGLDYVEPERLKGWEQGSSNFARVSSSTTKESGSGKDPTSIDSQIDAENRARLSSMSPEEIAEAQSEIMEKIDPNLLKVLQKRGLKKVKNQNVSTSVTKQDENTLSEEAKISLNDERKISHAVTTTCSTDMQKVLDNSVGQKSGPSVGSLWDLWSHRVESIREMRFSLDGNVVRNDNESSNGSDQSIYNANNVGERDFLRTEGDPASVGYTIKEAIALTRSVIPGQRALAMHLLTRVLKRALHNICKPQVESSIKNANDINGSVDWEAVWTYALGPEPELVLSLRMSLDDNHSSVVLACAKLIQCILSCDENENFFNLSEKLAGSRKSVWTAPVFRSKPEINVGFLQGGFWKYSAKPSNILPFGENIVENNTEEEHTIQDDIVVAGQDFAAGLVRMGILPRILYLLETDPSVALEECLLSVLIAVARHSPTCANAIMKCERLVQTVVNRFTMKDCTEIHSSKIKSVRLLKALACSDKKYCAEFIEKGIFQNMTWQLYQYKSSLDHWIISGKENCALSSALMVEQLRFWRVCILYGYGIAYFSDLFPVLCLWLTPPTLEKVLESNVLSEFASISVEAYLILAALAGKLPKFHAQKNLRNQMRQLAGDDMETWCWSHVGPVVDIALKWLTLNSSHFREEFYHYCEGGQSNTACQSISRNPLLWVLSAVLHMLSTMLERIIPSHGSDSDVPWLPEFVPRIGLEIIKNKFLNFVGATDVESSKDLTGGSAFTEILCQRRHQGETETSLACVCCLKGLVRLIISIDKLVNLAKAGIQCLPQIYNLSKEGKILESGILKWSLIDLRSLQDNFTKLVASEWKLVQSVEKFSRGGLAPGVGVGWGAPGGGFWSTDLLLAQVDAEFLVLLHEIFQVVSDQSLHETSDITNAAERVNSVLEVCLILGPRDIKTMEKALNILLQVPVLKFFSLCIKKFLHRIRKVNSLMWDYDKENYQQFSNILLSHYKKRWLFVKKSRSNTKASPRNMASGKVGESLQTIYEDVDTSSIISQECRCAAEEWARQRLPLPTHWFLSPIATIADIKKDAKSNNSNVLYQMHEPTEILEVAKAGLFMLLGVEAMCFLIPPDVPTPVMSVPLVWKLHSLSVILLVGMGVLEEKSRDIYEALQDIYGQMLSEAWHKKRTQLFSDQYLKLLPESEKGHRSDLLRFQADVHESYVTFIETLVEQFSAISYGDIIFGRQVAIYLHRAVEDPLRLATWNTLSNARVLDLLPPMEKCLAGPEGYLEPIEDHENILEAYAKSWTSGALDRAAARGSVSFTLVLHHLSSFIFHVCSGDKLSLRNKLVRSLLLDYSQKPQHKGMMMDLIQYKKPENTQMSADEEISTLQKSMMLGKFEVLVEACKRNSSLLTVVEKLRSEIL